MALPNNFDAFRKASGFQGTPEEFIAKYSTAPKGGWTDENTYETARFAPDEAGITQVVGAGPADESLQGWLKDPSLLPQFSLYKSDSPEDMERGFNALQYMSPRNIHEFWQLDKETQKGMLQNPALALQQMRALENPSNADWLSGGAEGGFKGWDAYKWNPEKGLTADPSKYIAPTKKSDWGGIGSLVGSALMFTPLAPLGAAINAVNALEHDNPLGAALSMAGAAFPNMSGNLGSFMSGGNLAASNLAAKALGAGALGGVTSAVQGGNPLQGALTSGVGSYLGGQVAGALGGNDVASGLASGLTKGAVSNLVNQQFQKDRPAQQVQPTLGGLGQMNSNIGTAAGGLMNRIAPTTFTNITNPAVRNSLIKQLFA